MNHLVDFPAMLLVLVKHVLLARVAVGDILLQSAQLAHECTDLSQVVARVPLPTTMDSVPHHFYGATYYSAIHRLTSIFDGPVQNESVDAFIDFALSFAGISASTWFIALIYVDRLVRQIPSIFIHTGNIFKLFSTALMLATKFHEEREISITVFANFCYTSTEEMMRLEEFFLKALDHRLFVTDDDLATAEVGVISAVVHGLGEKCGIVKALRERGVGCVQESLKRAAIWTLYQVQPNTSVSVPNDSAFALLHGDGYDGVRVKHALASIAQVQLTHEFGHSNTSNLHQLVERVHLLPNLAFARLLALVRISNGVAKSGELPTTLRAPWAPWASSCAGSCMSAIGNGDNAMLVGFGLPSNWSSSSTWVYQHDPPAFPPHFRQHLFLAALAERGSPIHYEHTFSNRFSINVWSGPYLVGGIVVAGYAQLDARSQCKLVCRIDTILGECEGKKKNKNVLSIKMQKKKSKKNKKNKKKQKIGSINFSIT